MICHQSCQNFLRSKTRFFSSQISTKSKWKKYLIVAVTLATCGGVLYEKIIGDYANTNPKYLQYMFYPGNLIRDMIKNNHLVIKNIPIKCLNQDICNHAIYINPNCISSIPESFRTDTLRKEVFNKFKYGKYKIESDTQQILLETPLMFIKKNMLHLLSDEEINGLVKHNKSFKYAYDIDNRKKSQLDHIKNNTIKTEHTYEGWDCGFGSCTWCDITDTHHSYKNLPEYLNNNDILSGIPKHFLKKYSLQNMSGLCMNGRQFNEHFGSLNLTKITHDDEKHNDFQLRPGLNVDIKPFDPISTYDGGIFFTHNLKKLGNIYDCGKYHPCFKRKVTIPNDDDVIVMITSNGMKSNKLILGDKVDYNRS